MSLHTVQNSQSQDITYQGELLSGSEVCVGLAPHHLMFEITAHATQKAVSKRNFLINLFGIMQKKYLSSSPVCWIWREKVAILCDLYRLKGSDQDLV